MLLSISVYVIIFMYILQKNIVCSYAINFWIENRNCRDFKLLTDGFLEKAWFDRDKCNGADFDYLQYAFLN